MTPTRAAEKRPSEAWSFFGDEGVSAKVASLPAGFDPDSFVRKEKAAGFRRILDEAVPVVDYMLQQALRRHGTQTVEGKVRIVRELLPALNRLRDPLEQNLYVEQIAQRLGLKESQIRDSLQRQEAPGQAGPGAGQADASRGAGPRTNPASAHASSPALHVRSGGNPGARRPFRSPLPQGRRGVAELWKKP